MVGVGMVSDLRKGLGDGPAAGVVGDDTFLERLAEWAPREGELVAERIVRQAVMVAFGDGFDRAMHRFLRGPDTYTRDELTDTLAGLPGSREDAERLVAVLSKRQREARLLEAAEAVAAELSPLTREYLSIFVARPDRRLTRGELSRKLGGVMIRRERGTGRPFGELIDVHGLLEPAHDGLRGYGLTERGRLLAPHLAGLL